MRRIPADCSAASRYPTVDESLDRLHRAGWSVGDYGTATRWVVSGTHGHGITTKERLSRGHGTPSAWGSLVVILGRPKQEESQL
jgi:hypothetical protein